MIFEVAIAVALGIIIAYFAILAIPFVIRLVIFVVASLIILLLIVEIYGYVSTITFYDVLNFAFVTTIIVIIVRAHMWWSRKSDNKLNWKQIQHRAILDKVTAELNGEPHNIEREPEDGQAD